MTKRCSSWEEYSRKWTPGILPVALYVVFSCILLVENTILPDSGELFTQEEMKEYQLNIRAYLDEKEELSLVTSRDQLIIAGFDTQECDNRLVGSLVLFDADVTIIETVTAALRSPTEYSPGYLGFRELPIFLECYQQLSNKFDIAVFDGYGILHPRKMGLATHVSAYINIPTFGIAKSQFIGEYTKPAVQRGSWTPIMYSNEIRGVSLRTQTAKNPVFVSVGWGIDLETCIEISLQFSKYRIPELTRQPDIMVRSICRKMLSGETCE